MLETWPFKRTTRTTPVGSWGGMAAKVIAVEEDMGQLVRGVAWPSARSLTSLGKQRTWERYAKGRKVRCYGKGFLEFLPFVPRWWKKSNFWWGELIFYLGKDICCRLVACANIANIFSCPCIHLFIPNVYLLHTSSVVRSCLRCWCSSWQSRRCLPLGAFFLVGETHIKKRFFKK